MTSQRRQTLVNVWRLPAKSFETAVVKAITDHLSEHAKRHTVLDNCDVTRLDAAAKAVFELADTLEAEGCKRPAPLIRAIAPDPDQTLIRGLCNAHEWVDALKSG